MKKVEANAAKINEPDHRLIWWPKVRGKWPRHRSVDHLIHAHVSLSLSSVLHASAFLHSKCNDSPLFDLLFRFVEMAGVCRFPSPLSEPMPHSLPSSLPPPFRGSHDTGMRVRMWPRARSYAWRRLVRTWCIRGASSAEASAFRCTTSPEFQFDLRRDRIGGFGEHKREKLSVSRDKIIQ